MVIKKLNLFTFAFFWLFLLAFSVVSNNKLFAQSSSSPTGSTGGQSVFCVDGKSISTAFGCLPIDDHEKMVSSFIKLAFSAAGGVAIIIISTGAFMVMTSQADPQRLQSAQGLIFAAITGLLVIVLSVFLLRLLSVQFLGLF